MRRRLLMLLTAALLAMGCDPSSPQTLELKMPAGMRQSVSDRAAGRQLFKRHCARCHGTSEEKRSTYSERLRRPVPDFTESMYRRADPGALFLAIRQGKSLNSTGADGVGMPAWGAHLSEQESWQLVAYVLSRSGIPAK